MDTFDIIDALGGRKATADLCDVGIEAVKKWRDGIPPKHWETIVQHTNGQVSFEMLAEANRNSAQALAG